MTGMEGRAGADADAVLATGTGCHRVKVYRLGESGSWLDKGTGHICVEYLEQAQAMGLVVVSEDDNGKALLVHKISEQDVYTRGGEATIINWHDKEINTDVAISFQEQAGCEAIWNYIKHLQQQYYPAEGRSRRALAEVDYDQAGVVITGEGEFQLENDGPELPPPEVGNLEEIAKILTHTSVFQRERVAQALLKPKYIPALLDIFKQCEDLEDMPSLRHMFRIVKAAIMLNEPSLLEEMLKEEHVMDVVGALEYDPDLTAQQKHREFLQSCVQFKEVVPITDAAILAKIHQTYRIQYLKDVILPRALDDATYATLSSLALFNNVEVVSALQGDAKFLPELFARLDKHTPDDPEWKELVAFLQEFCSLARHLQQSARHQLFGRLVQLGLFNVVTRIMKVSSDHVKLKATDILLSVMQHDVGVMRDFLHRQDDKMLFSLLVREFIEGSAESGLPEQISELFKILLDPETMETEVEKNEFLEDFYDKYLHKILLVIVNDKHINKDGTRYVPATTLGLIVDLLCFCVQHHSYRVKYFTLRSHLVEKVLKVINRRERWLVCSGIRFLRTCITIKDEFFIRHLAKNNVFEPVMNVFFENGDRYNLLNSAVLDIVDFIRRENLKVLVTHLVEQYGHRFHDIDYVEAFKALKLRYDQAQERQGSVGPEGAADAAANPEAQGNGGAIRNRTFVFSASGEHVGLGLRRRREERGLDKEEEDYFDNDVSGDWDTAGSADSGGPDAQQEGPRPAPGRNAAAVGEGKQGSDVAAQPSGAGQAQQQQPSRMPRLVDYDEDEDDQGGTGNAPAGPPGVTPEKRSKEDESLGDSRKRLKGSESNQLAGAAGHAGKMGAQWSPA